MNKTLNNIICTILLLHCTGVLFARSSHWKRTIAVKKDFLIKRGKYYSRLYPKSTIVLCFGGLLLLKKTYNALRPLEPAEKTVQSFLEKLRKEMDTIKPVKITINKSLYSISNFGDEPLPVQPLLPLLKNDESYGICASLLLEDSRTTRNQIERLQDTLTTVINKQIQTLKLDNHIKIITPGLPKNLQINCGYKNAGNWVSEKRKDMKYDKAQLSGELPCAPIIVPILDHNNRIAIALTVSIKDAVEPHVSGIPLVYLEFNKMPLNLERRFGY